MADADWMLDPPGLRRQSLHYLTQTSHLTFESSYLLLSPYRWVNRVPGKWNSTEVMQLVGDLK